MLSSGPQVLPQAVSPFLEMKTSKAPCCLRRCLILLTSYQARSEISANSCKATLSPCGSVAVVLDPTYMNNTFLARVQALNHNIENGQDVRYVTRNDPVCGHYGLRAMSFRHNSKITFCRVQETHMRLAVVSLNSGTSRCIEHRCNVWMYFFLAVLKIFHSEFLHQFRLIQGLWDRFFHRQWVLWKVNSRVLYWCERL